MSVVTKTTGRCQPRCPRGAARRHGWPAGLLALFLGLLGAPAARAQSGTYDWTNVPLLHEAYPGIQHVRLDLATPRLMKINVLRVDLQTPNLRFTTTGRIDDWQDGVRETLTKTTRQFINESRGTDRPVVAAINAQPWTVVNNSASVPVNLIYGLAISEGVLVSSFQSYQSPSFIVTKGGTAEIIYKAASNNYDTSGIQTAVSGFLRVLNKGVVAGGTSIEPRTGIGLSQDGRYAQFMTVDGRATQWSLGASEYEVGDWLRYFGAYWGINMDGGGSSTMAWWDPAGAGASRLLNVPRDSTWYFSNPPAQERYVGSNIGIFYVPEPATAALALAAAAVAGGRALRTGRRRRSGRSAASARGR